MAKKSTRTNILTRGTEVCPVCHQSYVRELEYRCVDCDSPLCPSCVVIEKTNHSCPDCCDQGAN
jgi:hypothetical protein